MAVRKPASVLLLALAIATLTMVAYVSTETTGAAAQEPGGVHGRRILYQSVDGIEPRRTQTFFSKIVAKRVNTFPLSGTPHFGETLQDSFSSQEEEVSDYGPPSVNPPIHIDPPGTPPLISNSVYKTLNRPLDTSNNVHEDYAPATSHPPIDYHDYPPGDLIPARDMTWSSEASFMHATLPPPTIIYHPENLSGN